MGQEKPAKSGGIELILTRRSIRVFTAQAVDEDTITRILEAAMAAPSAGNQQPWQFLVMQNRETLAKIPGFHKYAQMMKTAPAAVLVCGDTAREVHKGYWVQDCAAATQNILLAAHALGLGAVWVGVYPRSERVEGFRRLLGIAPEVIPFSLVPLGYPAEKKEPANRFDFHRIHYEWWGGKAAAGNLEK